MKRFLFFVTTIFLVISRTHSQACPENGNNSTINFPCRCFYGYRQDTIEWSNVVRIDCSNVTIPDVRAGFKSISSTMKDGDVISVRHFFADPILMSSESNSKSYLPPLFFGKFRFSSITIRNSKISSFDPMAFTRILYISPESVIDLSNNNFSSSDESVTDLLKKFSGSNISINLSGNKITRLPQIQLSLKQLNLSMNGIKTISSKSFLLENSVIDLSNNLISEVEEGAFVSKGSSGSVVNLSNNLLDEHSLEPKFVEPSENFDPSASVTINLDYNRIKFLHPEIYGSMTSPGMHSFNRYQLSVEGNPFECDCRMAWAVQKLPIIKCINDGRFLAQYRDSDFSNCCKYFFRWKSFFLPFLFLDNSNAFPLQLCDRIFHPCQCNGKTIDCSNVFYKVIKTIFEPLSKVYTSPMEVFDTFIADPIMFPSNTGPHSLSEGLFDFINFNKIVIRNSELSHIEPRAFSSVKSRAKVLDLSENQLNETVFKLLHRFPNLQILSLVNNNISTIPSQAFAKNRDISTINLSKNKIRKIESNAFSFPEKPSEAINYLDINLSSNNLTESSFDRSSFNLTNRFKVFTFLNDNQITKIDEQAFDLKLDSIYKHYLYLNENPIEKTTSNRVILRKHLINYIGFPKEKFCFAKPDCS